MTTSSRWRVPRTRCARAGSETRASASGCRFRHRRRRHRARVECRRLRLLHRLRHRHRHSRRRCPQGGRSTWTRRAARSTFSTLARESRPGCGRERRSYNVCDSVHVMNVTKDAIVGRRQRGRKNINTSRKWRRRGRDRYRDRTRSDTNTLGPVYRGVWIREISVSILETTLPGT